MAVPLKLRELPRRKLRYRLFRIQNGIPLDDSNEIQSYFEGQPAFDGWHNFTVTWDVGHQGKWPNGHWKAAKLRVSAEESWNETLLEYAQDWPLPDLPGMDPDGEDEESEANN